MAIKINRLTNANIYINGNNHLGKAKEVELPDVKYKQAEHEAIGSASEMEFFSGGIEKMSAKIMWNSYYADIMAEYSDPAAANNIQIRASLDEYEANSRVSETKVVVSMVGYPKNFPLGSFKRHDNNEVESEYNVTSIKLEIGGEEIFFFDALASILRINGQDKFATVRANLGL